MPSADTFWKTIRVFISSTFRDMHAERDYLVKHVFPEVRERCREWKLILVDIDLRWGVTEAQSESGKVIDVCFEQIDGSRPLFLCILGNRYGYVPEAGKIDQSIVGRYLGEEFYEGRSITHLEIEHALFDLKMLRPDPENYLNAFFYFRDPGSVPLPESLKEYTQEEIENYTDTFFERDENNTARLEGLKKKIHDFYLQTGKDNGNPALADEHIFKYSPIFDASLANPENNRLKGRFTRESLRAFGERVKSDLLAAIKTQYKERIAALGKRDENEISDRELEFHEAFVQNTIKTYVGRAEELKRLYEFVNGSTGNIMVVYGKQGIGKTALLSKLYAELKAPSNAPENKDNILVIPHFSGAAPYTGSISGIERRICSILMKRFSIIDKDPWVAEDIVTLYKNIAAKITAPVVIIVDGIDSLAQLGEVESFIWLSGRLAGNFKTIVSMEEFSPKSFNGINDFHALELTGLTVRDQTAMIRALPSFYAKTLEDRYIVSLLGKEGSRIPLFLKIAMEELKLFGSHSDLETFIESFPENAEDAFACVLKRIEDDYSDRNGLTDRFFGALVHSRHGLAERCLSHIMHDIDPDNDHKAIIRQLRENFIYKGELLDFSHSCLRAAASMKFAGSIENGRLIHRQIAKAVLSVIDPDGAGRIAKVDPWIVNELPYHMINAGMWEELACLLSDNIFVEGFAKEYRTRFSISQKLKEYLNVIPEDIEKRYIKINNMGIHLDDFSTCLELHFNDRCGSPDSKAACKICGQNSIIHGHIDIGASGTDYYDHYISWCSNCYWAWFWAEYNMNGEDIEKFNYATNTY